MSFEERKKLYLNNINEHPDYKKQILENEKNSYKGKVIIIDPRTEKELEFAESFFEMYLIIKELFHCHYIEQKNYESMELVNLFSEFIIALKNRNEKRVEDMKKMIELYLSIEFISKLYYQFMELKIIDMEGFMSYLCEKCGFDANDELSISQFLVYYEYVEKVFDKIFGGPVLSGSNTFSTDEELDINNILNYPLNYFVVINNKNNRLLEIYKDFIQLQNEFISTIEKCKIHENLFKDIDEIYVQDANEKNIPKLLSEDKLFEIILAHSYKEYNFDEKKNIRYDENYKTIVFNYEEIEKNLGKNMIFSIKKFIQSDGIRTIIFKDECYDDINNDILYDFQKNFKKKELDKNEEQNIEKFMENKNKKQCFSFLLSLQFLMLNILYRGQELKNDDDIYTNIIEKVPWANLDQNEENHYSLVKSFFEFGKDKNIHNFEESIDDDEYFLNEAQETIETGYKNSIITIDKLFNIYENAKKIYELKK